MEQHLRACRPYALPAKDPALGDILAEFRVTRRELAARRFHPTRRIVPCRRARLPGGFSGAQRPEW